MVLGGGGEAHTLRLDVCAPALPRLQRHLVPAGCERASERNHREGVAGVSEGAEEDPPRAGPVGVLASWWVPRMVIDDEGAPLVAHLPQCCHLGRGARHVPHPPS